MTKWTITQGRPYPMGLTLLEGGANIAVFSANATQIDLCLFDGETETRLPLPERIGDVWCGFVPDLVEGQHYGLRADGPWEPEAGHLFNPAKLLIDPYARRLTGQPVWDKAVYPDNAQDSAPYMPRCIAETLPPLQSQRPDTPMERTVFYEGHVKGLTARHPDIQAKGKYTGLAESPVPDHLTALGVTALELLPCHAFVDDPFVAKRKLTNYWGYQTLGFFAPEPRYGTPQDFQSMVRGLHERGIEVIMDVVYNHTCEGGADGPSLSFRGLDNASYYRLHDDGTPHNDTGCGNTVKTDHPMVLRLVMDSLRYWVQVMGVDGFRFDLCSTLGRTRTGFDAECALFNAIRQDPVLQGIKLIAEPWDIGPGGYQLGAFPAPFSEWNDRFRDTARSFWRGDAGAAPAMAEALLGSARTFDHSGRPATSSVNLITAHDGFTLRDLTSYKKRHNKANGEHNRDGHGENVSDNCGVEGPTDDPVITAKRAARGRAMLATLMLAQGTPMLLAGDEIGHTQNGNNNAYCQDNETTWINWAAADTALRDLTAQAIALRKQFALLRQPKFLHGEACADGHPNVEWQRPDGSQMLPTDWQDDTLRSLCLRLHGDGQTPLLLVLNAGDAITVKPPRGWACRFSTQPVDHCAIPAQTVAVYAPDTPK